MENYKRITRDSYNKNTKEFSEKFGNLKNKMEDYEMRRFLTLLNGKRILDLGCGAGSHAEYFSKKGLDVTCIDISKEMIKSCRKKGLNANIMDIESLKFKENEFDGIWAVTSLLHLPKKNLPKIIKSLHEILKGKGMLYVCIKEGKGENFIVDKNNESTKRFFSFWKKEELEILFKENFNLVEFKRVSIGKTVFLEFFFQKN